MNFSHRIVLIYNCWYYLISRYKRSYMWYLRCLNLVKFIIWFYTYQRYSEKSWNVANVLQSIYIRKILFKLFKQIKLQFSNLECLLNPRLKITNALFWFIKAIIIRVLKYGIEEEKWELNSPTHCQREVPDA